MLLPPPKLFFFARDAASCAHHISGAFQPSVVTVNVEIFEVFATPMFDTLPLDAVVGRCLVLEPRIYVLGRPRMPRYDEAVFLFVPFAKAFGSELLIG